LLQCSLKKKKKSKNKTLQNDVAGMVEAECSSSCRVAGVVEAECSCRVAGVVEALKNKRKNRNKKTYKTGQPT
jgi:hypothetical protein